MPGDDELSFAARYLQAHPELRARILASSEFQAELRRHPRMTIDGEEIVIFGGDQQKDVDQVALDWAVEQGLVGRDEIDRARAATTGR